MNPTFNNRDDAKIFFRGIYKPDFESTEVDFEEEFENWLEDNSVVLLEEERDERERLEDYQNNLI